MANSRERNKGKSGTLHPRNPHAGRYDFDALCRDTPELEAHLRPNPAGDRTIDFSDPASVLCLNQALLAHHYGVRDWRIPPGYLCPPIPGRADCIHHVADLLGKVEHPEAVRVLDIGTGANAIYPIIGHRSYGWNFVGTDIDPVALESAGAIVKANPPMAEYIAFRHQAKRDRIFEGVIEAGERFDLSMCNPPFFASADEARESNARKVRKLGKGKGETPEPRRNFGGQHSELWCRGGELAFLRQMICESATVASQVQWFTSLVSNREHLDPLRKLLAKAGAKTVKTIDMAHGQKRSRVLAWRFR